MKKLLFFFNLLMLLAFFVRLPHLPPQIPLFYSKSWGEDQLVDSWMIFILPLLMNGFFALNEFLYRQFFNQNVFVGKIVNYFNLFLILTISTIFLKIIFLVT